MLVDDTLVLENNTLVFELLLYSPAADQGVERRRLSLQAGDPGSDEARSRSGSGKLGWPPSHVQQQHGSIFQQLR